MGIIQQVSFFKSLIFQNFIPPHIDYLGLLFPYNFLLVICVIFADFIIFRLLAVIGNDISTATDWLLDRVPLAGEQCVFRVEGGERVAVAGGSVVTRNLVRFHSLRLYYLWEAKLRELLCHVLFWVLFVQLRWKDLRVVA